MAGAGVWGAGRRGGGAGARARGAGGRGGLAGPRRGHEHGHNYPTREDARKYRRWSQSRSGYDPFKFEREGQEVWSFHRTWDKHEPDYRHLDDHLADYRKDYIIEQHENRERAVWPLRLKHFEEEVRGASDDTLAVVEWFAEWCGPSREGLPKLEAIGRRYRGVAKIFRVEYSPDTREMGVCDGLRRLPCFHFYRGGELVGELEDPPSLDLLEDEIASLLGDSPPALPAA